MSGILAALVIVQKDVRTELRRVENLATMIVFAILIVIVFVFAGDPTPEDLERLGPGALWVSLLFAGAIGFQRWFDQEEINSALQGLLLTPVDRGSIYVGKWVGATLFLSILELVLVPLVSMLYGLDLGRAWPGLAALLAVVTIGYAALGTFFSGVAARTTAGQLLLPILLFPLSVPLLLAGAEGSQALLAGNMDAYYDWIGLAIAFDVIFGTLCTMTFEHVISE